MSFRHKYRPLAFLNAYHHYFLDDGRNAFDDEVSFPGLKEEQLNKYSISSFLNIIPSQQTQRLFAGQKIIFKKSTSGFTLWINCKDTVAPDVYEPKIDLSQLEVFHFLIYATDSLFENYSTISATPTIPFYFSNKKPTTEPVSFKALDLEATFPHTDVTDYTITQETYDIINESLSEKEKRGLLGIIALHVAGDAADKSLLDTNGETLVSPPSFKVQFKNRKTFWSYLDSKDGSFIHKSPSVEPLVKNGIVGYSFDSIKRPAATPNRLVFVKDGGGTIIETISEIFIQN